MRLSSNSRTLNAAVIAAFVCSLAMIGSWSRGASASIIPLEVYNGSNVGISGTLEVSGNDFDSINFKFTNTSTGPFASKDGPSFAEIYFESGFGDYLSDPAADSIVGDPSATVTFVQDFSPGDPQAKNDIPGVPWNSPSFAAFNASPPPTKDGINPGEMLTITFGLKNNVTVDEVITAISDLQGDTRIALHALACSDTDPKSCNLSAVPIPGAIWLLASALIGLVAVGRAKGGRATEAA